MMRSSAGSVMPSTRSLMMRRNRPSCPELRVRELRDGRFKRVDRFEPRPDALELALVVGAKDLLEDRSYHELLFSTCLEKVSDIIIIFPRKFKGNVPAAVWPARDAVSEQRTLRDRSRSGRAHW